MIYNNEMILNQWFVSFLSILLFDLYQQYMLINE